MGRVEYWNDPAAPKPNSLVPACGILAALLLIGSLMAPGITTPWSWLLILIVGGLALRS